MGTSRSAFELSAKLAAAAGGIQAATREGIAQASLAGKEIMIEGPASSGVRPESRIPRARNGRWSVRFVLSEIAGGARSLLRYVGPLHWIEGGTDEHPIPKQGGRRRAKALAFPDGEVRLSVTHPGTEARPFWDTTKAKVVVAVPKVMQAAQRRNLIEKFGP